MSKSLLWKFQRQDFRLFFGATIISEPGLFLTSRTVFLTFELVVYLSTKAQLVILANIFQYLNGGLSPLQSESKTRL